MGALAPHPDVRACLRVVELGQPWRAEAAWQRRADGGLGDVVAQQAVVDVAGDLFKYKGPG